MKKIFMLISLVLLNNSFAAVLKPNAAADSRVEKQIHGDYGKLKRPHIPLATIQEAWDKGKGGYYEVDYKPNREMRIRLREHMHTTIELPHWEKINRVYVGDEALISTSIPKGNVVVLHPHEYYGADTSISIIGKGYNYVFYVRIEGYDSKNVPDLGVKVKAHPPHRLINKNKQLAKEANDYLEKAISNPADLDFNFSMSGDKEIAPKLVYSDGIRTWLYYGKDGSKQRVPLVSAVIDGVDTPVKAVRQNNSLVVRGNGIFTLRNGGKVTCVYPTKLGRHNVEN